MDCWTPGIRCCSSLTFGARPDGVWQNDEATSAVSPKSHFEYLLAKESSYFQAFSSRCSSAAAKSNARPDIFLLDEVSCLTKKMKWKKWTGSSSIQLTGLQRANPSSTPAVSKNQPLLLYFLLDHFTYFKVFENHPKCPI